MRRILISTFFACLFFCYKSQSQVLKFRVLKVMSATYKEGSTQPVTPKKYTTNFIISFDPDKEKIIIHMGKREFYYDCFDLRMDTPYCKMFRMKAIDDDGEQVNVNLEIGENNQYEGYDGQLQIIYTTGAKIYYFKVL